MDIELLSEDDPIRLEIRQWLENNPKPTGREMVDAGYVVPHWPRPWGLDAEPALQLVIDAEFKRAGISRPMNPIGIGHCGPIILLHGTDEQRRTYLPGMLAAEEMWCQLFSEPGAGSDLANLSTRAERDGDVFVVNGQKIWTSLATVAKYGILIARTNVNVPKHTGISYFIVPMDLPGIEVRPIKNMIGGDLGGGSFCEVFFTDVQVPVENLVGELNGGWAMAKETLANERISLSKGGVIWGMGPTATDLVDQVRRSNLILNASARQRLMSIYIEGEILRFHHLRQVSAAVNKRPGPDASLRKALCDPHGQRVFNLAKDLMGPSGMLADAGTFEAEWNQWVFGFLFSPALTVGGGTSQVLRNVIGERLLGLPHDPDTDRDRPWAETRG